MSTLGTLLLFLISGAIFFALASLATSAVVLVVVRRTAPWAPESRHRALLLVGLLPPIVAFAALASVVLPSVLGLVWPAFDHCLVHEGHAHLCFTHGVADAGRAWAWIALAAAGAHMAVHVASEARGLRDARRLVRRLTAESRHDIERNAWVLPTPTELCLSIGLLRPRLMVSEGLLANTLARELDVMLAHERAHQRRKDTLARLLVRLATPWLLPSSRRCLLAALELSAETACDEDAASSVGGDRLRVAETLLAMERRLTTPLHASCLVSGFGSNSVPERVEALLLPPRAARSVQGLLAAAATACVVLLAACQELHHATESLLGFVSH